MFLLALAAALAFTLPAFAAEYVFGVNPWQKPDALRAMFRPLLDYLEEQTGIHFRVSVSPTYDQLTADLNSGYAHLGTISPAGWMKAKNKYPRVRYLATAMKPSGDGIHDYYLGYFIVRRDSPFNSLEDLRRQRFAFVEMESTSGYKVPVALMHQKGIDPKTFFRKYFFVGNHDEVASAVAHRCVEGGVVSDTNYEINRKKYGDIFRIILKTPPIPNEVWLAGADVPSATVERLRSILLSINQQTRTTDGRLVMDPELGIPNVGWSVRDDAFYKAAAPLLLFGDQEK